MFMSLSEPWFGLIEGEIGARHKGKTNSFSELLTQVKKSLGGSHRNCSP